MMGAVSSLRAVPKAR